MALDAQQGTAAKHKLEIILSSYFYESPRYNGILNVTDG